jgi:hypothetical protein
VARRIDPHGLRGIGSLPGLPCPVHDSEIQANRRDSESWITTFALGGGTREGLSAGAWLIPNCPRHLGGNGYVWGVWMSDLLFRMEQNRKAAEKFSDLAKSASSPSLRAYYSRIAERYLSFEEGCPAVSPPIPNRGNGTRAASMTGLSDILLQQAPL